MQALEQALAAVDAFVGTDLDDSQRIVRAKVRGLLRGYAARWEAVHYNVLAVEQLLTSELYNPATQRKSRSFTVAGKLDVIAEQGGRTILVDHKTTSDDISDPNSSYWRQLVVEGQVNHYYLLGWLNGQKFDQAIWDVVRKPSISPKKLTKAYIASVVATGHYCGSLISRVDRELLAGGEERETPDMYETRLAHDCTFERPERYFQRRAVPRLDGEIMEYAGELWDHGQDMLAVRNTGRNPRNSGACMLYGAPCKFLGICSGHDTPDSDKWQRKQQVHSELDLEGDGRDVLTNSRIRTFQTCRRKHEYSYELGLELQDEEEREALYFGNVWHAAMNSWWQTFQTGEQHGNASGSPAIDVGQHEADDTKTIAG